MAEKYPLTDFGKAVKIRMIELGIQRAELAQRIGRNKEQISRVMHGQRVYPEIEKAIRKELGME